MRRYNSNKNNNTHTNNNHSHSNLVNNSNSEIQYKNQSQQVNQSQSLFSGAHAFHTVQQQQPSEIALTFQRYLSGLSNVIPQNINPNILNNGNHQQQNNPIINVNNPGMNNMCNSHSHCSTQMIMSLFQLVEKQTAALDNLNHKVYEVVENNTELKNKLEVLEEQKKVWVSRANNSGAINKGGNIHQEQTPKKPTINNILKLDGESVTSSGLIQLLFGNKQYQYQLRLADKMQLPLYRERNFNLSLELIDGDGKRILNSNKIPLSLAIYSCQNPPKFIQKNTSGQKMLKGYVDQSLINGICHFQKVQVREVTSHYRNGWVYFVVIPCMPALGVIKDSHSVDFIKIKPLVIQQIIVKAKKPKKKQLQNPQNPQDIQNGQQSIYQCSSLINNLKSKKVSQIKRNNKDSSSEQWIQQ